MNDETKKLIESVEIFTKTDVGTYLPNYYVLKSDFDRVVEELTAWVKVEDGAPTTKDIVLVKSNNCSICIAYWHGDASGFITYGDDAYNNFGEITEWKTII